MRSSHPEPQSQRECVSNGGAQRSGIAGRESEGKGPATPEAQFFDAPDLEQPQSTHAIAYYDWGRRNECVHGGRVGVVCVILRAYSTMLVTRCATVAPGPRSKYREC
jgi:hypothetical protein